MYPLTKNETLIVEALKSPQKLVDIKYLTNLAWSSAHRGLNNLLKAKIVKKEKHVWTLTGKQFKKWASP